MKGVEEVESERIAKSKGSIELTVDFGSVRPETISMQDILKLSCIYMS